MSWTIVTPGMRRLSRTSWPPNKVTAATESRAETIHGRVSWAPQRGWRGGLDDTAQVSTHMPGATLVQVLTAWMKFFSIWNPALPDLLCGSLRARELRVLRVSDWL